MATSKSTVVGIRLDHDRRAWVEGEAARLGVSVRGLFEGMIDEARSSESAEASWPFASSDSAGPRAATGHPAQEVPALPGQVPPTTTGQPVGVNASATTSATTSRDPSPWPDLGQLMALPGGLIRGAFSLTTGLIESGGRFAIKRLGTCALTRRSADRSL
jgi:hypothetical protein